MQPSGVDHPIISLFFVTYSNVKLSQLLGQNAPALTHCAMLPQCIMCNHVTELVCYRIDMGCYKYNHLFCLLGKASFQLFCNECFGHPDINQWLFGCFSHENPRMPSSCT